MTGAALNLWLVGIGVGGVALAGALSWWSHGARPWRRLAARIVAAPVLLLAVYCLWYRFRPWPTPRHWKPHPAVTVQVLTRDAPRPVVLSVATVDLDHPGLELVLSEPAADGQFAARTTEQFADEQGLQLAVNAQFFTPFSSTHPMQFYPQTGELVRAVGFAASDGATISAQQWRGAILYFDRDGRGSATAPDAVWDAVGGRNVLVTDGEAQPLADKGTAPRVGLGLDPAGRTLIIAVVDGRQPGYSEGMTLPELAALMAELGAHDAIELDGGGSAALVVRDGEDLAVINTPIHTRIPGRLRPVASNLGIRFSGPSEPAG